MKSVKKMKADSASHLLRQPVSFELFLFAYLACALVLQKINIYKTVRHGRVCVWWASFRSCLIFFPLITMYVWYFGLM